MLDLAPLLVSAVILGLLGGGHCLGMCGGLMGALTLAIPKEQRSRRFRLLLAYNLGRILSYATAGLLLGLAGWAVANSPGAMFMRILAGLLLICMGLYLAGWWSGLTRIESLGRGLWRHIQPVATRLLPVSSLPRALLLGALWGWLPCGLVYSTLIWSASQGSAMDSALLMLAFGLGTWPVLLATGLAAERVTALLRKRSVRMAGGLLVICMGLYLAGWWSGLTRIESLGRGLWRHIQPVANRLLPVSSLPRALLLGALWGWLPCGLVYSTLIWSASQGSAIDSALLMLAFGLGTWPVLLATGLAAERVTAVLRKRSVRMAGGLLVILFGIWTLPGPHQHWLMGH